MLNDLHKTASDFGEAHALCDQLTGALVGIARASSGNEHLLTDEISTLVMECLIAGDTRVDLDPNSLRLLLKRAEDAKRSMVPNCFACANPCGRTSDYDLAELQNDDADVRSFKLRILDGVRKISAAVFQPASQGYHIPEAENLLYTALFFLGENAEAEDLSPILKQTDEILAQLGC